MSPDRIPRITTKLAQLWAANPNLRLGQLLEQMENRAWDLCSVRYCAPRLMELPDELLEMALDERVKT